MRKRGSSRLFTLGSIVAVAAGCSGGGSASVPAQSAPSATKQIASMAHVTITPTALIHAMSARRRPSFIDVNPPEGDALSLHILTNAIVASGGISTETVVPIPSGQVTPLTVSFPLYGPTGSIDINEKDSFLNTIADTGGLSYTIPLGTDVTLDSSSVSGTIGPNHIPVTGLTLRPIVANIAVASSPTGVEATVLSTNDASPTCMSGLSGSGGTLFLFPVDALGNFTTANVPGAFPTPVTLSGNPGSQILLNSTAVPGAFTYSGLGTDLDIEFDVTDIFGHPAHGALSITTNTGGYLCSSPPL
jgi:hypothetical protein